MISSSRPDHSPSDRSFDDRSSEDASPTDRVPGSLPDATQEDAPEDAERAGATPEGTDLAAYRQALRDLHAATLAVVLHTGSEALLRSCQAYSTRQLARYFGDAALTEALEAHLHAVEERACEQADALAGTLIAEGLRELSHPTDDA